jgi:hypothetical protein
MGPSYRRTATGKAENETTGAKKRRRNPDHDLYFSSPRPQESNLSPAHSLLQIESGRETAVLFLPITIVF